MVTFGICGRLWAHFGAAYGGDFGVTLGVLAADGVAFVGHFEVILGSFWGQFGYLWVTLGHLMVALQ